MGAVAVPQLEVIPVDLSGGESDSGDVDDHGLRAGRQRGHQAVAQHVATQVVERKGRLEPVARLDALR